MNVDELRRRLGAGAIVLLCLGAARAQDPTQDPTLPGARSNTSPVRLDRMTYGRGRHSYEGINELINSRRSGADVGTTPFQGFPTFPGGFGTYPMAPKDFGRAPLVGTDAMPPPALPEPPDWPSWIRTKGRKDLIYVPEQAIVVRIGDRVWVQPAGEPAAVPLYFFDGMKPLGAGSLVEVRQAGEFQVMLYGGSRLNSSGPVAVKLLRLDEQVVELEVSRFSTLWLRAREREHVLHLPDGSTVTVPAAAPDQPHAEVRLLREVDHEWRGGRGTLQNYGPAPVRYRAAHGEMTLQAGRRITLWLNPPRADSSTPLQFEQATRQDHAGTTVLTAGAQGGKVRVSGASIGLGAGDVLTIDPNSGVLLPAVRN